MSAIAYRARIARQSARAAVRTAKYLYLLRAALPRPVRMLVTAAVIAKIVTAPLPVDGGIDELLIVLAAGALLLSRRSRALLHVCYRAALSG